MATREEGIKKGYLENRKVILKPIPRGGKMITDPKHSGYFMWEGASKMYCLTINPDTGNLASPFKDEAEQRFFSELLDIDLNPYKRENNYWRDFYVKITKDMKLMEGGVMYDLSDPADNLSVRVLKQYTREIAPNWDQRFERITYKFALVDEGYEEKEVIEKMELMQEVYKFWGSIEGSLKKMREFLGIYWMTKKALKNVPVNSTKDFLTKEISRIIEEDKQTVYNIIKDEDINIKYFIFRAMRLGAISRSGVNTYTVTGDDTTYGLAGLIEHIKFLKETTDPIYQKMEAQINTKEEEGK